MLTRLRSLPVQPSIPSHDAPARRRRARGLFAALALAVALPAAATAQPPGGPVDNPGGATVTISNKVINPVGTAGGGVVNFTGEGFADGEVVSVKVDDGRVATSNFPANVFTVVTANGDGEISGSVDLAGAAPAHTAELASGKHRLRFLSSAPAARSTHTEFAVTSGTLPAPVNPGPGPAPARGFVGPEAGDAFGQVPEYTEGAITLPFRVTGFTSDTPIVVSLKINDGDLSVSPPGTPANGVVATVTPDAAGAGSGTLTLPAATPGTYWLRFLAPGRSVIAPYVVLPKPVVPVDPPVVTPPVTTPTTTPSAPKCPTRPRFNSVIYSNGVTSFHYRPLSGQKILGARRLGVKTVQTRLATPQGRSTLPRLEYTTAQVVDAKRLPWFARKVGPRRVVVAILSNADSTAYSGVRIPYRPKSGSYAKLILPNGNVQTTQTGCPKVTGYKTIYAQNILVNRRSS